MSDENQFLIPESENKNHSFSYISIDVSGKDVGIWKKWKNRFVTRIKNSFAQLLNSDVPGGSTINSEAKEALENIIKSTQEIIKKPQLENMDRLASIKVKLSEAKLNEAMAKKAEAEARKIDSDANLDAIERDSVHNSQKIIGAMIKRGELIPISNGNDLILVINSKKIK